MPYQAPGWDNTRPVYHVLLNITQRTHQYWSFSRRNRPAEVVLLVQRPGGRYLVHTKSFYPPGTWRLLTGGVHPDEDVRAAALRESAEEIGAAPSEVQPLARLHYDFFNQAGTLHFDSFLYLISEPLAILGPRDSSEQITGLREVELDEFARLAAQLETLQGEDWADWGRFRAVAHLVALRLLKGGHGPH